MLTIHLPEDLENYLRAQVESGRFASVDDAIALALRRLLKPRLPRGRSPKMSSSSTWSKPA